MEDYHAATVAQTLKGVGADVARGLSLREVESRLARGGANELREASKTPLWRQFLAQFEDFVVLLLIAASLISFALGERLDAAAIMAIVVLNAIIGFVQEYRAEKALEALKRMVAPKARVLRDGGEHFIDARKLVVGDIVLLDAGDLVPADCRLVESSSLAVVESSLTGESEPVAKDADAKVVLKAGVADRRNMVFMGTAVARGAAHAVVVATGMHTQVGAIAEQVQKTDSGQTPLQRQLDEVGKRLSLVAIVIVAVVFAVGVLLQEQSLFEMFLTSVALAVAAVPEGLPAIVTITLAIGVQQMARRKAIVRKLHAVETLGSATVICSDKTGTLTKNEMTVRHIYAAGKSYDVSGTGFGSGGAISSSGRVVDAAKDASLRGVLTASVLCNSSSFEVVDDAVKPVGDPTEVALLVAGGKGGVSRKSLSGYVQEGLVPFESERKMMSSLYRHGAKHVLFVKGAPEEVLARCTKQLRSGRLVALTPADRKALLAENEAYARSALRVLAVAYRDFSSKPPKLSPALESQLVFSGLVAMNDPARPEAREAIALCKSAGIRVIMITGDNPLTAKSIASELGILSPRVVTGTELDELGEIALDKVVAEASVYARVSPQHKYAIVSALKRNGEVVAMTGDGVNDAPALKHADIGIAMGITGTDVSREASAMVLEDDNFASIVNAVSQGRVIYSNIEKSIRYLLSCNIGEIVAIFLAMIVPVGFLGLSNVIPLLPIQILWMNLVTDGLPALALGMDTAEPDVMRRKPRDPRKQMLDVQAFKYFIAIGAIIGIGTLLLFYYELLQGSGVDKARTVAFTTIILFQLFHALNSRSMKHSVFSLGVFSNKALIATVVLAFVLQVAVVQLGLLEAVFKTVPLDGSEWLLSIGVAASVFVLFELYKAVKK